MYFTRYVTQAKIRDIGTFLRESQFIVFLRLGASRPQLSATAEQGLELRMEMLESPVVDCDKTEAKWEDIREVFEHLGRIIEGLEDDRPFFVAFESERLRDAGASRVPCRVAYVEQAGEGTAVALDFDESCLAAFGEIYAWILSAERQASRSARRQAIVDLLDSLFDRLSPAGDKVGVVESPGGPSAPDLLLQVKVTQDQGKTALTYFIHDATGKVGFHLRELRGPVLDGSPDAFAASLFEKIEKLHEGYDVDGGGLLLEEAEKELADLGQWLYRKLFPPEMRAAYRKFREAVQTLQITSDEPWIPWEMVKPFDNEVTPPFEDDFLCARFQLTRWLAGEQSPAPALPMTRLAVVGAEKAEGCNPLPNAMQERQLLASLAGRHSPVDLTNLPDATFNDLKELLRRETPGLLHFVGHGDVPAERSNEAKIVLKDRPFRAYNLSAELQAAIQAVRPLVFLNACRVARQGWSLSGLGGWAEAWVRTCGCGAFLGPQWVVKDGLAFEFARVFYESLEADKTFGESVTAARKAVRKEDPGRPTWLAYAAYGHPGARMSFGIGSGRELPNSAPGSPRSLPSPEIFEPRRLGGREGAPAAGALGLPLPPPLFLGRDDDLRILKEGLCRSPGAIAERGPLLLVTGWPGVGKTTMTMALANDAELREAFPDGILWTSLDQSPSLRTEISSWCIALGSPGPSPTATIEEASLQLGHLLRRRRVLLLVDDVWDPIHATPFLVGGPACAMLATSRLDAVAEQLAPTSRAVYRLPLLSEEAGLELLRSRAPEIVAAHAEECRILVRELEGLPLSLHVAGRMLAKESRLWSPAELLMTLREGRQLLEERAPNDRADLSSQTLPTLSVLLAKSTERLPPELLERFAYLGDFAPKPATFDLAALQVAWDVDDPRPSVRALVDLGLLEPVGEGRFRMHALLVAHAKSLLEE